MGKNGFMWKARGDPRQTKGIPDLVGVYYGVFFFMEVKVPGRENTLTRNQAEVIKRLKRAGAVGGVVTSRAEAEAVLEDAVANVNGI
jgi:hypothetical protein